MKKAEGKAAIDYGFHMIITELTDQVETEMDALVSQGVTSFKLFMAYPGVFMLDDASIFRAMRRTGKNGGTICMHAENGGVIDVLVKEALPERADRAEVSRADAAGARRGRGDASRDRARRNRRRARSTSFTCPRPKRSRWSPRRAIAACRRSPRRARSISSCRTTTTRSRDSRARST